MIPTLPKVIFQSKLHSDQIQCHASVTAKDHMSRSSRWTAGLFQITLLTAVKMSISCLAFMSPACDSQVLREKCHVQILQRQLKNNLRNGLSKHTHTHTHTHTHNNFFPCPWKHCRVQIHNPHKSKHFGGLITSGYMCPLGTYLINSRADEVHILGC